MEIRMFDRLFRRRTVPLELQLEQLIACGIRLNDGFGVEHLLNSFDRQRYESDPYELLLVMMGSEFEVEPFPRLSENVWHLDTECIEDHGSYARVAERIQALAAPSLQLSDIRDYVDLEEQKASLSFRLKGKEVLWNAEVNDDWIDAAILSNFAQLVAENCGGKRLTYLDLIGQDCLIGCSSNDELSLLKRTTGLAFEWLK
jgi:hypothetical protein